MGVLLKGHSTFTAKGQTTVPNFVPQALGVDYGGRISVVVDDERRVYVQKAEVQETSNPVIDRFLEFVARDMADHAEKSVLPFPQSLLDRAIALTAGMTVALGTEIEGGVSI
jgi:antitoxin PrlF